MPSTPSGEEENTDPDGGENPDVIDDQDPQPEPNEPPSDEIDIPAEAVVVSSQEAQAEDYHNEEGIKAKELPVTWLDQPDFYTIFDKETDSVDLHGEVKNVKELHRVEVRLTNSSGEQLGDPVALDLKVLEGIYSMAGVLPIALADRTGVYQIHLTAYGLSNEDRLVKQEIMRPIRIDRQAPQLKVTRITGPQMDKAYYEIEYEEDNSYIEVRVNNNLVERIDYVWDSNEAQLVKGKVTYSVPISYGKNEIRFTVMDDAGHLNEFVDEVIHTDPHDNSMTPDAPTLPAEEPTDEAPVDPTAPAEEPRDEDPVDPTSPADEPVEEEAKSQPSEEELAALNEAKAELKRYQQDLQLVLEALDQYAVSEQFDPAHAGELIDTAQGLLADPNADAQAVIAALDALK